MLKKIIIAVLGMASTQSVAQTPVSTNGKSPSSCEVLSSDWKRYEQNMSSRFVDGIADNSAPRATMREMREANDLMSAQITLQFMRDSKCTLPKRAPSASTYMSDALACSTARLKGGDDPPECDRSKWTAK